MKLFWVMCFLCVLSVSGHALQREAFSISRYDLNAMVEPEQQRLAVRGKITLRNDSDSAQKNFVLQISSSLNWISIRSEAKPIEFTSQTYTSDIDHSGALTEAIITPSNPVPPKQTLDLEIAYEGVIPQDATRLTRIGVPAGTAKHSDWDEIGKSFAAVRGVGYVAWYPITTEAASLSDGNAVFATVGRWKQREALAEMKIALTVAGVGGESVPKVICGRIAEPKTSAELGKTSVESDCSFGSMVSEVPFFAIGDYATLERPTVEVSYLQPHKSGADDFGLALDETEPTVTRWFGDHREKSAAKGELLDLPDPEDSPFESGDVLLMPLNGNDTESLLSAVRLQTREAFPSTRPWISGGLAGYAQAAFMQEKKNRQAAIAYLQGHRAALVAAEKENLAQGNDSSAARSLINDPDEFYVQSKAINVWWMLRDIVGEQAFTAALHNYHASEDKDAYYMQKLLEAQSHRDLGWFFNDWVYRDRGLPEFRIVSVFPRQIVNQGYLVTVTVENTGAASAEVPVTLHMAEGEATERVIVPGNSKASVRIRAPMLPQEATVNDGSIPEMNPGNNSFKLEVNR